VATALPQTADRRAKAAQRDVAERALAVLTRRGDPRRLREAYDGLRRQVATHREQHPSQNPVPDEWNAGIDDARRGARTPAQVARRILGSALGIHERHIERLLTRRRSA
jgi:hypothetical protein